MSRYAPPCFINSSQSQSGVNWNRLFYGGMPSSHRCSAFNVKMPSGFDKRAAIAAFTLMLLAAASWNSSSSSSVAFKVSLQQLRPAFIVTKRKLIGCRTLSPTKNAFHWSLARWMCRFFRSEISVIALYCKVTLSGLKWSCFKIEFLLMCENIIFLQVLNTEVWDFFSFML